MISYKNLSLKTGPKGRFFYSLINYRLKYADYYDDRVKNEENKDADR